MRLKKCGIKNKIYIFYRPDFLSHQADNLPKLPIYLIVTLVVYELNWMKMVEFLLIGYF